MQKFYRCAKCGKIVAIVNNSSCPTFCCGDEMKEIVANTADGAREKHVPVFEVVDNVVNVKVGEVPHPMLDVHFIEWISIETNLGNQRKVLKPGDEPKASFALLPNEKLVAVYAYCNLHFLYKAEA